MLTLSSLQLYFEQCLIQARTFTTEKTDWRATLFVTIYTSSNLPIGEAVWLQFNTKIL